MSKPTIDEILESVKLGGQFHESVPMMGVHVLSIEEAKQQVAQLIADIVGEDAPEFWNEASPSARGSGEDINEAANLVRAEQRQRAKSRGIDL